MLHLDMQIRIEPDLAMPIKLAAVKRGMTVPKFVSRILRSALKLTTKPSKKK